MGGSRTSTAFRINCTPYSRRPSSHCIGANSSPDKASGHELTPHRPAGHTGWTSAATCWMTSRLHNITALFGPRCPPHGLANGVACQSPVTPRRVTNARGTLGLVLPAPTFTLTSTSSLFGVPRGTHGGHGYAGSHPRSSKAR